MAREPEKQPELRPFEAKGPPEQVTPGPPVRAPSSERPAVFDPMISAEIRLMIREELTAFLPQIIAEVRNAARRGQF